ncbi:MAG TPA: ABC transporter permease [Vicinamibacterales bacterium]|nr:ABC transporter permease [Vicinamibacterales bacterium]
MSVKRRETARQRPWQLVLEPGLTSRNYWSDLWRYRELMYFLAWRDILVRYKQTAIGVTWALLRPAATMLVFIAFRRLAGIPSGSAPEPVLVFAAVLPWQFFSAALTESSASLIGNANLISKVYFPRLIIPAAAVATAVVDFAITLGLLAALMVWYGVAPGWELLALPVFVAMAIALSLGVGVCLAALNVEYRDFRYIVPFVVQFGLFISPIAFTLSSVPERWQALLSLNPMVGIIEGFRWSILGNGAALNLEAVALSTVVTSAAVLLGVRYFRRMERSFADVI